MIDAATAYLILTVSVIAASIAIGKAIHWFYKWANRIEDSQKYIESEMRLNGGATMRDAIDRIDKENVITNDRLENLENHLNQQDIIALERHNED